MLLKGLKVVIPKSLRGEMLKRLHDGHLGVNKCKAKARLLMFWPGMSADIAQMVNNCSTYKHHAYQQPAEPLSMRAVPLRPWARVGVDLFQYGGQTYLVAFDALRGFPGG